MGLASTITIPLDKYQRMMEQLRWLSALESAGVDNWLGIEYAYELMEEEED